MKTETVIEIGDAGLGGYWYAVGDADFKDGFATAWKAAQAAMAAYDDYAIYYRVWDKKAGCYLSIPGEAAR